MKIIPLPINSTYRFFFSSRLFNCPSVPKTFNFFKFRKSSLFLSSSNSNSSLNLRRTTMTWTNSALTSKSSVTVKDSIDLTDKEKQIFDRLLQVLRHFNLQTQLRVAGGWVRDKVCPLQWQYMVSVFAEKWFYLFIFAILFWQVEGNLSELGEIIAKDCTL